MGLSQSKEGAVALEEGARAAGSSLGPVLGEASLTRGVATPLKWSFMHFLAASGQPVFSWYIHHL